MDKFIIHGGKPLKGDVKISGAKNAALPILAAVLLTEERCVLHGVPQLRDVTTMLNILKYLGVKVRQDGDTIVLNPKGYKRSEAPYALVSTMRASFCVLGPLLARKQKAKVSLPGGCVIGPRPVDLHLKGLRALGARLDVDGGYVLGQTKGLRGKTLYLGGAFGSTVLGTANIMMAATLAKGTTVIEAAACEPEVVDLGNVLIQMGAKIEGLGTPVMRIEGVQALGGFEHRVIRDRIETGTFLLAAAMTGGDLSLHGAHLEHLGALVDVLETSGIKVKHLPGDVVRVKAGSKIAPMDITTLPYPGFPTDMQAQMMALMCQAPGISVITEKIYPERFMHVPELSRMGAQIKLEGASAIVHGGQGLKGAPVMASDLRASAGLVLAGLSAQGKTEVARVYHIDRGYERIDLKLKKLGANIRRVKEKK